MSRRLSCCPRPALRAVPALVLTASLSAGGSCPAASLPPGLDPETKAALAEMIPYEPPAAYSEDLVITTDGRTMTMRRAVDGAKMRTDMDMDGQQMTMIELGDADGTTYTIVPSEKRAMKMTSKGVMEQMHGARQESDAPDAENAPPPGYKVEYLGKETVDGREAKKFRMSDDDGSALGWFDAATGAPIRMEGSSDEETAVIEWKNFRAEAPAASMFDVPKGYDVTDMDEIRAQMKGMPGMENMMKGMAGGMMGGMGSNLGAQLGGAAGGPLGMMAGGYLGGRVGSAMEHR